MSRDYPGLGNEGSTWYNGTVEKMNIRLTLHAQEKLLQRNIDFEFVRRTLSEPERIERDRNDPQLVHYIRESEGKFLRVIGRWEEGETVVVISAFFDRRILKQEERRNEDSLRQRE